MTVTFRNKYRQKWPEAFAAMQKDMKLTELAEKCRLAINDNPTIQAKIKAMKEKRELIPYKKK